ncbi:MAG: response regulator [Chloroflexi bacterium]|nr:response regulator [Chloroflexota bacterium]
MIILVAEDDADIRSLLGLSIEMLGHTLILAQDGQHAWELFQEHGADVIISDWLMPRMQGTEFCRRIRATDGLPYVYFILLTALESENHMLEGMRSGADDYLTKPFTIGALHARLVAAERVTELHRALAQRDAERSSDLARQASVLRVARRMAAEVDPDALLNDLIVEAVALVGGSAGAVYQWDDAQATLLPVASSPPGAGRGTMLHPREGAAGRAAEARQPIVLEAASAAPNGFGRSDGTLVAVPLLHEGRLLGSMSLFMEREKESVTEEEVAALELLAGIAAAAHVGLERAQLLAVTLAARELAHLLNNDLSLPVGAFELLKDDPAMPAALREVIQDAAIGLEAAVEHVRRLQQIVRIQTKDTPIGPALDLEGSVLPHAD